MDEEIAMEETAPMDYRLVCRTCLASDAEFYKLEAPIFIDDEDTDEKPISFLECLHYCTRLGGDINEDENLPFPIYICTECSASLQVSYNFLRNAREAHEILRQKLSECSNTLQQKTEKVKRKNGVVDEEGSKTAGDGTGTEGTKMRFRCKICNEKVETKKALKEHVKFHLDIISYCCQLCSFECKKRALLMDHYRLVHNAQATQEQLKPKTKTTPTPVKKMEELDDEDPITREMDKIHNAKMNEDSIQTKTEQADHQIEKHELDMQLLLTPVSSNTSAARAYIEAAAEATDSNADYAEAAGMSAKNEINSISTELEQYGTEQFNVAASELSVGNEFIVMADGTVEEVMANGVVIEYINATEDGVTIDNGMVMDNIMHVTNTTEVGQQPEASMDMDVDDIIIEETINMESTSTNANMPSTSRHRLTPETTVQTLQNIEDELPPPSIITPNNVITAKRIKCKICTNNFPTQDKLKTHMLTHNEIPHFFCDQCSFYTFFKIDLTQHYKTKHKLQPTQKQLQPKNRVKSNEQPTEPKHVYACDLCLFETRIKSHLRRHYLSQHQEEATEVQLRPTIDEAIVMSQPETSPLPESPSKLYGKSLRPDYPKGLNCKKCSKTFYWRDKLKDHYRQHSLNDDNSMSANAIGIGVMANRMVMENTAPGTSLLKHNTIQYQIQATHDVNNVDAIINAEIGQNHYTANGEPSSVMDEQAIVDAVVAQAEAAAMQMNVQMTAPAPDIIMDIPVAATISTVTVPMDGTVGVVGDDGGGGVCIQQQPAPVAVMTSGYACQQIPSDAIPQIVETDTTIDNSELDFVFNDALFEDFEEEENEDEENEEEDGEDFQDLLLTSDDDFEDILQDQQQQRGGQMAGDGGETINASNYQPYCVHCNKKFLSQYQFENHMFVHRGLAPYRCEMCTNLYNTKRALIRHYRAVHKRMPTRDMIQAKGDKVIVDHTPIENLDLIEQKAVTLMCAKCPFESVELHLMQIHLNTTHGLMDENYILQKLPFECPRCIRSYASRSRLIRHLERSHSVATIIQQHRPTNNAMRNQLQIQQPHQQQHQQQPYLDIKDEVIATTSTTAVSAVPVTDSSTSTNTSCGRITHSYHTNYNSNINDDNDDDGDGALNDDVGALNDDVGVGGYVEIEENNNNHHLQNSEHEMTDTTKISPLSKLITEMEREEKTQTRNIPETDNKVTTDQPQTVHTKKHKTISPAKDIKRTKTISKEGKDSKVGTHTIYQPANEHNELFDKYACGMCSQSWRTAAELHAHECGGVASKPNANKSPQLDTDTAAVASRGSEDINAYASNLMSERSLYLFKCDICHCNYKSSELLKHHMKRHVARRFQCSHCPKTFINRSELKCHQLSHTGERPYKCDRCPKEFRYSCHLKRHRDIAHLGKRVRCPVESCGRTFTTQAQLKVHAWVHDGNEPYRCKYCRHSFNKRESLRRHARRIHQCDLTEQEIAEIYRKTVGHTNPHDLRVSLSDGQMLSRSDIEQATQRPQKYTNDLVADTPAAAVTTAAAAEVAAFTIVKTETEVVNDLSPLLASNIHDKKHIKIEMGVAEEDEAAAASTSGAHLLNQSHLLVAHEETIHTYILPGMEEQGRLPHLEHSGTF